jgi:pilus assembly protein CpaC
VQRALLALAAGLVMAAPARAQAQAPAATARVPLTVLPAAPCGRVEIAPVVEVNVGKSTVLRPARAIRRVLLGSPESSRAARPTESTGREGGGQAAADTGDRARPGVAEIDVLLLSPTEVYVLGKAIGSTNVVLLDDAGQCTAFDVVVGMDTGALQTAIAKLLPDEKNIRVTAAFDSVVLQGSVTDAAAIGRVIELTNAYVRGAGGGPSGSVAGANPRIVNMLSTGAPQQVMLEVKVAEISKSLVNKLGVQLSGSKTNGNWTYTLLSDFLSTGNAIAGVAKSTGALSLLIDAQKDDGLVKVLAEPTVMAISGQKGSFLAGGKIFIPVASSTADGIRTISLEEKTFGVGVNFLPTVLDGSRINLAVKTEVSELNREGIGITAATGTAILPSFTSRSAETTVQLMDGQSFAIGGLIKNNATTNIKAFPFLGELPVVGALFRSTDFQTDKSELVFVITPRLVKPLPPDYKLPTDNYITPSRTDLHLHGRVEGRPAPAAQPAPNPPAAAAPAAAPAADAAAAPATGGFQVK